MTYTQEQLTEIIAKHGAWLRGEDGGKRANLTDAYLAGANLVGANLADANLAGAYLAGAYLLFADCCWTDHGKCGRRLLGIAHLKADGAADVIYYCGCFRGSETELRAYIADRDAELSASRTLAVDFVAARIAEMLAKREGAK